MALLSLSFEIRSSVAHPAWTVRDLQVADKAVSPTQASRNHCVLLRSSA